MKKNMKKIVSLMLAMVMVIAMSLPVFAAADTTLTINAADGHTYEVYQMLVGDVSGLTNGKGTLANVTAGENLNGTVEAFDAAIKGDDGKYLTGTALSAAASAFIKDPEDPFATYGTSALDCEEGYYIVKDCYTDSGVECAAYMVAVVGPTTMNPKTTTPPLDKNITDTDSNKALETGDSKKTDTAAIGDVINYKTTSEVPVTEGYKYYYYVLSDTMSKGLTFNNDLEIKIGDTPLTEDEYVVELLYDEEDTEKVIGFELVVNDMKSYTAGDAIEITYSATVNEEAEIGKIPNTNTTNLTYSNNPSDTFDKDKNDDNKPGDDDVVGVTPDRVTKTYVTQLTLQKTDGTSFINDLKGATFKLEGKGLNTVLVNTETVFVEDENGSYYKLTDGTYTQTEPTDETVDKYASTETTYATTTKVELENEGSAEDVNITAVVDANGTITFTGLNVGEYVLSEVNVPAGYNKCDDIKFEIKASQTGADELNGGAITWTSTNAAVTEVINNEQAGLGVFETEVINNKGAELPSTGGMGTTLFYVVGLILVMGAGVILVARRRAR